MTGKFHATPQGALPCRASKRPCRYGEEAHAETLEEAQVLVERRPAQEAEASPASQPLRKAVPKPEEVAVPATPEGARAGETKPRTTVNVAANEHLVVRAMVQGRLLEAAAAIARLPQEQRTDPFRGRSKKDILFILQDLRGALRSHYGAQERYTMPLGNQNAQDLYAVRAQRDIELKIGYAYTDAAIGMETAAFMVPEGVMKALPTRDDRNERALLYRRGRREEAKAHFRGQMEALTALPEEEVAPEQARALNLFVAGVNRGNLLREHMENPTGGLAKDSYDLVIAQKSKERGGLPTWTVGETRPYREERTWTVKAGATSQEEGASQRLHLLFTGSDGVKMRFTYNQKNSWPVKMQDGTVEKTGYEYGLGSPSFNVWITD